MLGESVTTRNNLRDSETALPHVPHLPPPPPHGTMLRLAHLQTQQIISRLYLLDAALQGFTRLRNVSNYRAPSDVTHISASYSLITTRRIARRPAAATELPLHHIDLHCVISNSMLVRS